MADSQRSVTVKIGDTPQDILRRRLLALETEHAYTERMMQIVEERKTSPKTS